MLSSSLQQILDNRLRYLPEITGKAIASVDWPAKLIDIAKKYGLHVDEIEDLQSVVMRSMVGMIAPQDFEQSLIAALALSPANAEKMIAEINAQIFQPIHDYVMQGGKNQDAMASAGIHVEVARPDPLAEREEVGPSPSISFESDTPAHESASELSLPEVRRSAEVPSATKSFHDTFFPEPTEDYEPSIDAEG